MSLDLSKVVSQVAGMVASLKASTSQRLEHLKQAMSKLGPCLVELFGQAESPMSITYLPHRDHILDGTANQMTRLA